MISRNATKALVALSRVFPVVAVTGPRQSGKTTLVKDVFKQKPYVNLEDIETREFAENDPRGFLAQFPNGAVLDEVQRVPSIFSYIQTTVDTKKDAGLFVLTGSQQFGIYQHITQSLAGRVASVILLPFAYNELKRARVAPGSLEEALLKGFYPPIYDRSLEPSVWYSNYVRTYVERDVRQMVQIRDLSSFQRFVRMCAARTGQLLNLLSLANDCGISHNTAKAWISILEASFIVYLLKPYFRNFNKRLVKTPKLYFVDPGLAAWLLGIREADQLLVHTSRGALFETFVISELLKKSYNDGIEPNLYFWRDRTGNKVDVIFDDGNTITPLEIKSGRTIAPDYFDGLMKWSRITGIKKSGWLIYGGDKSQRRSDCTILPWHKVDEVDA
jgi:predicted AAA+ superfamily ATPase